MLTYVCQWQCALCACLVLSFIAPLILLLGSWCVLVILVHLVRHIYTDNTLECRPGPLETSIVITLYYKRAPPCSTTLLKVGRHLSTPITPCFGLSGWPKTRAGSSTLTRVRPWKRTQPRVVRLACRSQLDRCLLVPLLREDWNT